MKEELIEPSGPFLLPQGGLPPDEVLAHLGSRPPPVPVRDEEAVVLEPSGPLALPGAPPVAMADAPEREDGDDPEVVLEPSGPLLVPMSAPPLSLESSEVGLHGAGDGVPARASQGASAVRGGVVRGVLRAKRAPAEAMPSIVVDPAIEGAPAALERPEVSWTPLAVAFVAGMLAGAALVLAILRI